MKAVLILPETDGTWFAANLVDRPFLRHIVEFMVDQGIQEILIVGAAAEKAKSLLGKQYHWGAPIAYSEAQIPSQHDLTAIAGSERCLIASGACLPRFPFRRNAELPGGAIVYGGGERWTGWAVVETADIGAIPPLSHQAEVLSYLEGLQNYTRLIADPEFRCAGAEDLWNAHRTAQESNLSGICHTGVEVSPGVWIGRNASVAAGAEIKSPVYIGENTRIGPGAQIGPYAVIAKDCLIAPGTRVRHAVVAPGTYAGNNLELDHVLVNRRQLFDIRFGVSIDRVDSPMLDGVFDFHWSAIPRWVRDSIAASVASWFRSCLQAFSGLRQFRRRTEAPDDTVADAVPESSD